MILALRIPFLFAGCLLFFSFTVKAQFSLTAEVRPRTEYRHGFKTIHNRDQDPAFFTEQRTRLYSNYKNEKFRLGITIQDVRIWGSTDQVYKEDISLTSLAEGWGEYFISEKFSVKAGRQFVSYDNERMLGSLGWAQQGRSHEMIVFKHNDSSMATSYRYGF